MSGGEGGDMLSGMGGSGGSGMGRSGGKGGGGGGGGLSNNPFEMGGGKGKGGFMGQLIGTMTTFLAELALGNPFGNLQKMPYGGKYAWWYGHGLGNDASTGDGPGQGGMPGMPNLSGMGPDQLRTLNQTNKATEAQERYNKAVEKFGEDSPQAIAAFERMRDLHVSQTQSNLTHADAEAAKGAKGAKGGGGGKPTTVPEILDGLSTPGPGAGGPSPWRLGGGYPLDPFSPNDPSPGPFHGSGTVTIPGPGIGPGLGGPRSPMVTWPGRGRGGIGAGLGGALAGGAGAGGGMGAGAPNGGIGAGGGQPGGLTPQGPTSNTGPGFGLSGGILGAAEGAAAGAASMGTFGAGGAAAQLAMQEANRAAAQIGQYAAIGFSGLGETFKLHDSEMTSKGGWFDKIAGGLAGGHANTPNTAGQTAKPLDKDSKGDKDPSKKNPNGGNVNNGVHIENQIFNGDNTKADEVNRGNIAGSMQNGATQSMTRSP
jgi:hypothetical protein